MYRTVFTDIWRQRWFEELSVDARYLYLYFWTNPETRPNGIISTSKRRVMFDSRLDEQRLDAAVAELEPFARCLWEHGVVWVPGFAESQGSGSKWQKAVDKANQATPPEVLQTLHIPHEYPSDTPSIGHPTLAGGEDTPSMPHPPGTGSGPGTASGPGTPSGAKAPSGAAPTFSPSCSEPVQVQGGSGDDREAVPAAPAAAEPQAEGSSPSSRKDGGGTAPRLGANGEDSRPESAGGARRPPRGMTGRRDMDAPSIPHPAQTGTTDTPSVSHPRDTAASPGMGSRRKTGGNPQVDGVLEAIEALWGQPVVHWAKEAKEVKAALARGYEPEQVVACFQAAQESPRWRGRWMPLAYLVEDLGEFVKNGGRPLRKWGQPPGKEESRAQSHPSFPTAEDWRSRQGRW